MIKAPEGCRTGATDDRREVVEPDDIKVWTACAVSFAALFHLAAAAVVLSTRTH